MLLTIVLVVVVAVLGYVYGRKVEAKLVADAKAIEAEVDKLFAPAVVTANAVVSVANVSGNTANVA